MDTLKFKLEKLGYAEVIHSRHGNKLEKFYFEQQGKESTISTFMEVIKWLFQLNQIKTNWNHETDISKALDEISSVLKSLKIAVPSATLKLGYGPEIVAALNNLCDRVLPRNGNVIYKSNLVTTTSKVRQVEYQFIDEQIQPVADYAKIDPFVPFYSEFSNYSIQDPILWNKEVESIDFSDIIPKNHGEWRLHWELLNGHIHFVKENLNNLKVPLNALIKSNTDVLEKILAREKHLNDSFQIQISEYRAEYEAHSTAMKSKVAEEKNIKDMSQQLLDASNQLDNVLKQMDEHGSKITDATPLADIKTAIIEIKRELQQNDIILQVYRQGYLNKSMETV